jgi:predicted aldo/keto reductase-like oxidoreductase
MAQATAFFPDLKGKLGFGLMRLPMVGDEVDLAQTEQMVDAYMAAGFHYFDTAHGYISGQSETAARHALTRRYPRDSFILTNKLSGGFIEKEDDVLPLFQTQLDACGVDYFDFYLLHAVGAGNYQKFEDCRAFEQLLALKAEGKIRHIGFSFHDSPAFLDRVLTEHSETEVVQLQLNYLDWEDGRVRSRACYEVCVKHNKPVIVMEPVKGGSLVHLNDKANAVLESLRKDGGGSSNAGYALRFAAGLDHVVMVLSGMSDLSQMQDNLKVMSAFSPLDEKEQQALEEVRAIFSALPLIPCTACRYCTDGCPMNIRIPDILRLRNRHTMFPSSEQAAYYTRELTKESGKASECIGCGQCADVCPQHLDIPALLQEAAEVFE